MGQDAGMLVHFGFRWNVSEVEAAPATFLDDKGKLQTLNPKPIGVWMQSSVSKITIVPGDYPEKGDAVSTIYNASHPIQRPSAIHRMV